MRAAIRRYLRSAAVVLAGVAVVALVTWGIVAFARWEPPSRARGKRTLAVAEWAAYDAGKSLYLQCLVVAASDVDFDGHPCLDEHGEPVTMPEQPDTPRPTP